MTRMVIHQGAAALTAVVAASSMGSGCTAFNGVLRNSNVMQSSNPPFRIKAVELHQQGKSTGSFGLMTKLHSSIEAIDTTDFIDPESKSHVPLTACEAGVASTLGPSMAPKSIRNCTDEMVVPSAAELVVAAEEGRIIATKVLDSGFEHSSTDIIIESPVVPLGNQMAVNVPSVIEIPEDLTGATTVKKPLSSPGLRKIFKFAVPAIGVWLCGPILSLIDTASVGLLAGTAHQAALSPAVAVTEYSALLMAFLYTGTTNLVAASQESDGDNPAKPRTARTLIASLQLSLWVGLSFGTVLMAFSRPLLKALIGNDALDPVVFETALKYVRIRALGMPAGTVIGSAQAACMGMQDVKSPLYVLAAAALVNLMGDIMMVGSTHPWFGGAAGAAWATVFSQVAAMSLFMKWLLSRPANDLEKKEEEKKPIEAANNILPINLFKSETVSNLKKSIKSRVSKPVSLDLKAANSPLKRSYSRSSTSQAMKAAITSLEHEVQQAKKKANKKEAVTVVTATKRSPVFGHLKNLRESMKTKRSVFKAKNEEARKDAADDVFSTRGFLHGRFSAQELVRLPNREIAKEFAPYVMPITSTSVGRVSSYVAMSHVISSAMGTGAMAAQQVIISMFYCLTPIADSLNLTAQSLLPAIYEKPKGRERAAVLKKTAKEMMQAGVIFGGVLLSLVSMIPFVCRLFTTDPLVVAQVTSVVPLLAGSFVVHGIICAMEGCMLGQKDLGFLGKSYVAYFLGVPYFMLRVKKAALSGAPGVGLTSVWTVFMYYQLVRVSMFLGRVWKLGKSVTEEASEMPLRVIDDVGVVAEGQALNQIEDVFQRDFNATSSSFA